MENKEIEVDVNKQYKIPANIVKKHIDDKVLVISVDTANWIVLHNKNQETIFEILTNKPIQYAIEYVENNNLDIDELIHVLTQIEAKCFEKTKDKNVDIMGMCIYLTNECNLHCSHCYMYSGIKKNNELNTDEIFRLLNNFREFGGKVVTFTGGEVTQRNDLVEIINYSKSLGLVNTILTNGTQWDIKLINNTYESIDEIQISIDGYDERSNSFIRGENNFCTSLKTVDEFYNRNVKVTVAVTPILPIDVDKYIEFGKNLLFKYNRDSFNLKFTYELIKGRDRQVTNIDNIEYKEIIEGIVEILYPNNKNEKFVLNHKNNILFSNCGYGGITIASNGDVYFCNRITELKCYGNVRSTTFKEIVNMSSWVKQISDVDNLFPCKECDLRYICGGGCRIAYFPKVISKVVYESSGCNSERYCDNNIKLSLYQKMVETNELFYY